MLGNREVGDSGSLAEIERIILDDERGDSRGVIPLNAASKSPGRRTSTETTSAKASVRAARRVSRRYAGQYGSSGLPT